MISYAGYKPTIRERLAHLIKGADAPFAAISDLFLPRARWSTRDAISFFKEGYRQNSAVFACVRALATGFAEAPLRVYADDTKKKQLDKHPLQVLLKRPNEYMGEDEFWKYFITYAGIGGDGYGKIVMNNGGEPAEIWPYHNMVMWPVPLGTKWVEHYDYSVDNGVTITRIEPEEVVHFKWAINPDMPWRGLSPLAPVGREVDSDNELTRYLKSLLQNDAVPRTILKMPPGVFLNQQQKEAMEREWELKFGKMNRGRPAFLSGGGELQRVALDMSELAFDALRGVPEARIAAAFGVPAIVAGLNIGLVRSTYANFEEARKMFTEQTLVPLWKAVASEIQQALVPLFSQPCYVDFDLSQVRALSENTNTVATWVVQAWDKGLLTRGQALNRLGEAAPTDGTENDYKTPGPEPIPVTMDGAKWLPSVQTKSASGEKLKKIEARMQRDAQKLIGRQLEAVANHLEAA